MWRYSILSLLLIGVSCHTWAQNVVFTAQPQATRMGVKDNVRVDFTITNAQNLQTMAPPSDADFIIVQGPFTAQSYSSSFNGRTNVTSESITRTYILRPKHEGTLTIPPVLARDAAGHTYQSNPVTIQVGPGSMQAQRRAPNPQQDPFADQDDNALAMMQRMQRQLGQIQQQMQAPAAGPNTAAATPINDEEIKKDLFIRVEVDKSKVHVGEQITASYKLYSRLPMQVGISKLPSLNGFWTQDFDIPKQPKPTEEVLDGKKYQVFLLKKSALFPQQTGTLELDPAEAKGMARVIRQEKHRMSDMFNGTLMMNDPVFNNSFYNTTAYRDVEVHLKSSPIKVTVTALPEKNKPEDFGGAVGNFTIGGKLDKQELTTDEIATLTLTINGSGNLKLIEAPRLTLPNGISTFDPQITDTVTGHTTTISGAKIINYVISPHLAGDYDIPSVSFTYFNPQSEAYVTAHTQPFKLHVKPGKHGGSIATTGGSAMKDIHDIAVQPSSEIAPKGKPILFTGGYWSMYAFPLLAFIGLIVWKKRDEELSKDTVLLRSKRANKVALQRLVIAKKFLDEQSKVPFYEEISKATWLYLSDKLSIPLSALSHETATEGMNMRRVPQSLQKRVGDVIWECESALYASGSTDKMANTYEETVKVISELEDAFKA